MVNPNNDLDLAVYFFLGTRKIKPKNTATYIFVQVLKCLLFALNANYSSKLSDEVYILTKI